MRKRIIKITEVFLSVFMILFIQMSCNMHTHTYSDEWTYNEDYHWNKATCEHFDEIGNKQKHVIDSWKILEQPTQTYTGKKTGKCIVCGYDKEMPVISEPQNV